MGLGLGLGLGFGGHDDPQEVSHVAELEVHDRLLLDHAHVEHLRRVRLQAGGTGVQAGGTGVQAGCSWLRCAPG